MSRRTALASVCAILMVAIVLAVVIVRTEGQGASTTVKGFSFIQIGKCYTASGSGSILFFKVMQDLGNGWVAVQDQYDNELFVNLNQTICVGSLVSLDH